MTERTPNGPSDLLDDASPTEPPTEPPTEETEARPSFTIDEDEEPSSPTQPEIRGADPGGIGEREPSLISRLSTGAASNGTAAEEGGELVRKPSTGGSRVKEAALAEKTSKIMSDYQAYLAEIETEFPGSSAADGSDSEAEAERNVASAREAHRYRDYPPGTFPPSDEEEASYGNRDGLYRGWSHGSGGDSHIRIDRGVADMEDYPHAMMSVRRPKKSFKRVKRGLVAVFALVFVIGVSVGISKKRREERLPDWEAELAEAEGEEETSTTNGGGDAAGPSPEEVMSTLGVDSHPEMGPDDTPPQPMMGPSDGKITEALAEMYASVGEEFKPNFYDRSTGWKGQTYIEALEFCQTDNPDSPGVMRVCPYSAICPGGQGSRPIDGHKNENNQDQGIMEYGGSWVPIIDGPNEWVSIGNDNSCVKWSTMNDGKGPEWGETGEGNEQNTRHVMCCDRDAVELAEEEIMMKQQQKEEGEDAALIAMAQEEVDPSIQEEVDKLVGEGTVPEDEAAELPYIISASKYQPVYNNRDEGWTGSTYREAVEYCSGIDDVHMLCPFEALCPAGLGKQPMGSYDGVEGGMMWVPVADDAYSWVSVSPEQPCLPFRNQPKWGPDENGDNTLAESMTENIVCCLITTGTQQLVTTVADLPEIETTTTVATTVAAEVEVEATLAAETSVEGAPVIVNDLTEEESMAYESVAETFEPIWYGRDNGWTGQSYLQGMQFCADQSSDDGERQICPLTAICPLGRGTEPTGGASEGEMQWAPISDDPNSWVQISTTDTCLTYEYMNKEAPHWGLTGEDNEEITRFIACCLLDPGAQPMEALAETSDTTTGSTAAAETEAAGEATTETSDTTPVSTAAAETEAAGEAMNEYPEIVETESMGITSAEDQELYAAAAQTYQPLMFDRNSSPAWEGGAYLEALQFCAAIDSRVPCPYMALCPAGPGRLPSGGIKTGYAPVMNHPNSWVSIGPEGTCQSYSDLYGSPPEWGLTGEGDPDLTQNILCCIDVEDDKSEATSESENAAADQQLILTEQEQAVLDGFKPEWYGQEAGYSGKTYQDALEFCGNVAGRILCPMMAYCPNGDGSATPLFLQLEAFEGEQWAPVFVDEDPPNPTYVQIGTFEGNPDSTCKTYSDLTKTQVPSWSLDGSQTELKKNILCCNDPSYSTDGIIDYTVEEDSNPVVTQTEDSPTLDDGSFDLEGAVSLDLEPVWMDEEDGWLGGSHDDAEEFCQSIVGKSLCPYAAYCPHGPGQPVISGHDADFSTEGIQWAPVFGDENHWVLLSYKGGNSATTCMSHADLEGTAPDWGLSNARPWLKKHIMCCNLRNGF